MVTWKNYATTALLILAQRPEPAWDSTKLLFLEWVLVRKTILHRPYITGPNTVLDWRFENLNGQDYGFALFFAIQPQTCKRPKMIDQLANACQSPAKQQAIVRQFHRKGQQVRALRTARRRLKSKVVASSFS